jgi:uncharacterized membrane protein
MSRAVERSIVIRRDVTDLRKPAISAFLDIGQGAGLATSSGVRPFLPPLVAGGLARADAGIDFEGTGFAFLESEWWLLLVLVLAAVPYLLDRRGRADAGQGPTVFAERALALGGVAVGALLCAGSLAAGGQSPAAGYPIGVICAAVGFVAVQALFAGARRRLTAAGDSDLGLGLARDLLAVGAAALSVALDPAGYAVLVLLGIYALASRRKRGQKYEGLRVLR